MAFVDFKDDGLERMVVRPVLLRDNLVGYLLSSEVLLKLQLNSVVRKAALFRASSRGEREVDVLFHLSVFVHSYNAGLEFSHDVNQLLLIRHDFFQALVSVWRLV